MAVTNLVKLPKPIKTPKPVKPDVSALLAAAAKKPSSQKSSPFDFDGDLTATAGQVLTLTRQKDEIERQLALVKDEVRRTVDPWYQDRLCSHGHESSVKVPAGDAGVLRVTYQHRYLKLPLEKEGQIREIVGDKYETYFKTAASLKIRKEVADDPERLASVVVQLAEILGDKFTAIFEAEQTVIPQKVFTERRYTDLTGEQNEQLQAAGISQVVAFGQGK